MREKDSESICIVVIARDEEAYIDEWLVYHSGLGIDHFFIYDDCEHARVRKKVEAYDYCTLVPYGDVKSGKEKNHQIQAYNHSLTSVRKYKWVMFLDIDEFVVLNGYESIKDFLGDHSDYSAISLNWRIFGHNGLYDDSNRLVTASLTRRKSGFSEEVKTISQTEKVLYVNNPHYCILSGGERLNASLDNFSKPDSDDKMPAAWINHYQCRSFSTWMKRAERGDVNFNENHCPPQHQWRLSESGCLKEFVSNIALDKNECEDYYMLKYRFSIQEKLAQLNHREKTTWGNSHELDTALKSMILRHADFLFQHAHNTEPMGLYNGRCGIILFFYVFSRYSNDIKYKTLGYSMLNEISESLDAGSPLDYRNGLAGFGYLVEHLVKDGFMSIDTNEMLAELDELLHYKLIENSPKSLSLSNGITGSGKYFASRLNNPVNLIHHPRESANRKVLHELVDLLETPFNTYGDLIGVIEFLSESFRASNNNEQLITYLSYAADKLETMANEDRHFGVRSASFQPIQIAAALIQAFGRTQLQRLKQGYDFFLANFVCPEPWPVFDFNIYAAAVSIVNNTGDAYCKTNLIQWAHKRLQIQSNFLVGQGKKNELDIGKGLAGETLILLAILSKKDPGFENMGFYALVEDYSIFNEPDMV